MSQLAPSVALYDDEHLALRESVRTFLEREAVPAYSEWRRAGCVPRELLRAAGEHGFLGMAVPEEHGGPGLEDVRFGAVVATEAMLAGCSDLALVLATHSDVAIPALVRGAPADRRAQWLPGLASGELLATVAHGDVTAQVDGDAARLDGSARFVVSGAMADVFVVPIGDGRLAAVERGAAGVEVHAGEPSVGLLAAGLADVALDGAAGVMVGDAGAARELGIDQALSLALTAAAGARAGLAITVEYVRDRKVFGQPIADFANTRRMLAAVVADIDAADALVEACLRGRLAGTLDEASAAAAKLHCSDVFARAVDAGVQLHGGYGYIMEYPIAHAYADARFWRLHAPAGDELAELIAGPLF